MKIVVNNRATGEAACLLLTPEQAQQLYDLLGYMQADFARTNHVATLVWTPAPGQDPRRVSITASARQSEPE